MDRRKKYAEEKKAEGHVKVCVMVPEDLRETFIALAAVSRAGLESLVKVIERGLEEPAKDESATFTDRGLVQRAINQRIRMNYAPNESPERAIEKVFGIPASTALELKRRYGYE